MMLPGMAALTPAADARTRAPRGWAAKLDRQVVQRAVDSAGWDGIVLPYSRLSDYQGFPVISWEIGARERFRFGPGPVLVRQALTLWERWPLGVSTLPPPSPLRIVGFVSVATWRPAFSAVCELAGKGAMMILTPTRPSVLRLCDADYAGIHVVQVADGEGACEVLVRGRMGPIETARRTTNIRYWEETLFAHALASWREGVIPEELLPSHATAGTLV
ncbi:hypothetical protein [Mycobacteroides abscessus]|nr:hypothetical protein [Mycobacteroides abscessus]